MAVSIEKNEHVWTVIHDRFEARNGMEIALTGRKVPTNAHRTSNRMGKWAKGGL